MDDGEMISKALRADRAERENADLRRQRDELARALEEVKVCVEKAARDLPGQWGKGVTTKALAKFSSIPVPTDVLARCLDALARAKDGRHG
jgi:hypothetical protein